MDSKTKTKIKKTPRIIMNVNFSGHEDLLRDLRARSEETGAPLAFLTRKALREFLAKGNPPGPESER